MAVDFQRPDPEPQDKGTIITCVNTKDETARAFAAIRPPKTESELTLPAKLHLSCKQRHQCLVC